MVHFYYLYYFFFIQSVRYLVEVKYIELGRFTFILNPNPSFVDTTFQVKHLMIGHMLDGDLFI